MDKKQINNWSTFLCMFPKTKCFLQFCNVFIQVFTDIISLPGFKCSPWNTCFIATEAINAKSQKYYIFLVLKELKTNYKHEVESLKSTESLTSASLLLWQPTTVTVQANAYRKLTVYGAKICTQTDINNITGVFFFFKHKN